MKPGNRRSGALASVAALAVVAIWMLDASSASASARARGYAVSHGHTHRTAKRNPRPAYRGYQGFGSHGSAAPKSLDGRSWLKMEHYLDPCHCSDGI